MAMDGVAPAPGERMPGPMAPVTLVAILECLGGLTLPPAAHWFTRAHQEL